MPGGAAIQVAAPVAAASAAAPGVAVPLAAAAAAPAKDVAQGKDIFGQKCVGCHGAKGDQMGTVKLMDSGFLQQRGDTALQQTIGTGKGGMPAMGKDKGGTLTGDDITAVLAYFKSQAGIAAPAAPAAAAPALGAAPAAAVAVPAAVAGAPAAVAVAPGAATPAAPAALTQDEQALVGHGKSLFASNCTSCHGESKEQLGKLGNGTWLLQRGDRAISQTIADGKSVPGAPLAMPSFSTKLSADDIGAVVAYLKSVAGVSLTAAPVAAGPDAAHGKEVFSGTCAACHGPKGDQLPTARLNDASFLQERGDAGLTQIVTAGKGGMPAFGGKLSADDIASVLAFLESQAGIAPSGGSGASPSAPAAAAAAGAAGGSAAAGAAGGSAAAGAAGGSAAPAAASGAAPAAAAPAGGADAAAHGKDIFGSTCTACHGAKGDQMPTAKLSDPAFLKQRGDQALTQSIASGKGGMPAWSGKLSADDISGVLAYIKSLAGLDDGASGSGTAAAGAASPVPPPDPTASDPMQPAVDVTPEVGRELFAKNCTMCHGEDGQRMAGIRLLSPDWSGGISGKTLNSRITNGAPTGGMPAFSKMRGGPLSVTQVAAIVAYIKDTAGGAP